MSDIIDKIGRYFAEHEAQLRRMYAHAAASATPVRPPLCSGSAARPAAHRPPSSAASPLLDQTEHSPGRVVAPVPPTTFVRQPAAETTDDAWSDLDEDGFASWHSPRSRDGAVETPRASGISARLEVESSDDGSEEDDGNMRESRISKSDSTEAPACSDKPGELLRRRSSIRKKRRSLPSKTSNNEPDPEQLRREKEQKVAAALALAQERAKRIQSEREQRLRDQELARVEEQLRVQDEANEIEAIRRKSRQFALRLRPTSAPATPIASSESSLPVARGSSLSQSVEIAQDDDAHKRHEDSITDESSAETAIISDIKVVGTASFLDNLERLLRDKMVIGLRIREKSVAKHLEQEQQLARMQCEIDKLQARAASKQQRVQSLAAMKCALERELQGVALELSASRSQRAQLEETSRKERAQRQRDAKRQLKAQLRAEEWDRMMDDEKVRSAIAADARARASHRVAARAPGLKKAERRRSSSSHSCMGNQSEDLESEWFQLRTEKTGARSALLFPPELAEFEEEGLGLDDSLVAAAPALSSAPACLVPKEPSVHLRETPNERPQATASAAEPELHSIEDGDAVAPESQTLEWRVPRFDDYALFEKLLVHDMLLGSDEE